MFILLWFSNGWANAQTDTLLSIPNEKYARYVYNPDIELDVLVYHYGLWDIDGDNQKDTLAFTGNGGAHTYFHFSIWLSSQKRWTHYPSFFVDFPYPDPIDDLEELDQYYPQLVIYDFDKDGLNELYINFDNPFGSIPKELKEKGLRSKKVWMDYNKGELRVLNFQP